MEILLKLKTWSGKIGGPERRAQVLAPSGYGLDCQWRQGE
jgi:hypothetical protein